MVRAGATTDRSRVKPISSVDARRARRAAQRVRHMAMGELMRLKLQLGLKPGLTSCHTGLIDGYVIEGLVPASEVKRLLAERPDAIGLTVPDMPYGSPGMGSRGQTQTHMMCSWCAEMG
jgi:hypothetical protein